MIPRCPRISCSSGLNGFPKSRKFGSFVRSSDSRSIQRFLCTGCKKTFSSASRMACLGQKKRRLNHLVWRHLSTGDSIRRTARSLGIDPKTVARKLEFLAGHFREQRLSALCDPNLKKEVSVQFDEMESSIHSKCLPVTIPLAVNQDRKILDFQIGKIPAKGKLAAISRHKYGHRPDESREALSRLFSNLRWMVGRESSFVSDQKIIYPNFVNKYFPDSKHTACKGKRGCVVGQGELKKTGFDPLFALNHTAAEIRYGVSRLARRTWCTSKTIWGLQNHLEIFVAFHNRKLAMQSAA